MVHKPLPTCWAVPGASRTILEAVIPYSQAAQSAFLGETVEQSVTAEAAAAFARAAYRRALCGSARMKRYRLSAWPALRLWQPTDRRRGDHRAHIGLADAERTRAYSLTLHKGTRARSGEEQVVATLLLSVLAEACGLEARPHLGLFAQERVIVEEFPATFAL